MSPEIVAFAGEMELVSAEWSLKSGRTATFRICGEAYGRNHPFKKFQQRRSGRVGTRFRASFVSISSGETMDQELMLMAWKDSSTIGQTVSFWLDAEVALHPFAGCAYRNGPDIGDIFAVAIVELTDDDKPVRQDQADAVRQSLGQPGAGAAEAMDPHGGRPGGNPKGAPGAEGGHGGSAAGAGRTRPVLRVPAKAVKLSSLAHRTVTNPQFVQFLRETKPNTANWTPEIARRYAKTLIQVESLSDLDRDAAAAERFRNMIGKPYDQWRYQYPM